MMPDQSPLSEADPKSLDDLYTADPLTLTDNDVDKLVDDLREKKALWENEDATAQSQGRARRPKEYKAAPPKGQLDLNSLGLGKSKE